MFNLFNQKPLLDESTRLWLFDTFAWALKNFDKSLFFNNTPLILANDQFFPDQVDSPQQLVEKLAGRIQGYCHMQSWPCAPTPIIEGSEITAPHIEVSGASRGEQSQITTTDNQAIPLPFNPAAAQQPDLLIANLAQSYANLLIATAEPPPGGQEYIGPAVDVVAIFMGFGVFLTNNAFNIQRGCSSCQPPSVSMMGELTEEEMCYALAIFCTLKAIPASDVTPLLKKNLKGFFKKAMKQVAKDSSELSLLQ